MTKDIPQPIIDAFEELLASNDKDRAHAWSALAGAVGFDGSKFDMDGDLHHTQVRAAVLACAAHFVQTDKAGAAYIDHPRRVHAIARDLSLPSGSFSAEEVDAALCAALLHDVVEDSGDDFYRQITLADLSTLGFSALTVELVRLLTFDKSQAKVDYLRAIAANPLARLVKLADTCDNMNRKRQAALGEEKRAEFSGRYGNYMQVLDFDPATKWFADSINS